MSIRKALRVLKSIFWFVLCSGTIVYIMDLFFYKETEYGVRSHEFLDEAKMVHHFFGVLFVFFFGNIFSTHFLPKYKQKTVKSWKTGLSLFTLAILMILTGYSSLYLSNEFLMAYWKHLHFGVGLGFFVLLIIHIKQAKNE